MYIVTCGQVGYQNSRYEFIYDYRFFLEIYVEKILLLFFRNEVSVVQLKVTVPNDPIRKINTVLEGERYKLRAEVLDHDSKNLFFFISTCL